ncbi:MAG: hypothetical protein NTU80_12095 [Verrucomicrobia bacterium]|nr:hypothetical protein [Verrucomicrobiota bacterium]
MDVIPLTLTISLLLSLTFIALFLREFTRPRRAGAEHDSLLPLEADLVATSSVPMAAHNRNSDTHAHHSDHHHAEGEACSQGKPGVACCNSCRRRRERQEQKATAAAAASNTDTHA